MSYAYLSLRNCNSMVFSSNAPFQCLPWAADTQNNMKFITNFSKIHFHIILPATCYMLCPCHPSCHEPKFYSPVPISWHLEGIHEMRTGRGGYLPGEASEYCLCPSLFLCLSPLPHHVSFKIHEMECIYYTMLQFDRNKYFNVLWEEIPDSVAATNGLEEPDGCIFWIQYPKDSQKAPPKQ